MFDAAAPPEFVSDDAKSGANVTAPAVSPFATGVAPKPVPPAVVVNERSVALEVVGPIPVVFRYTESVTVEFGATLIVPGCDVAASPAWLK